jgi:hypothetical protein
VKPQRNLQNGLAMGNSRDEHLSKRGKASISCPTGPISTPSEVNRAYRFFRFPACFAATAFSFCRWTSPAFAFFAEPVSELILETCHPCQELSFFAV